MRLFITLSSRVPLQSSFYVHKTKFRVISLSEPEFKNLSKKTENRTVKVKSMKAILLSMGKANMERAVNDSESGCFSSVV